MAEGLASALAEGDEAHPVAFAADEDAVAGEVEVVGGQVRDLGPARSGVEEQADEGGVAAVAGDLPLKVAS